MRKFRARDLGIGGAIFAGALLAISAALARAAQSQSAATPHAAESPQATRTVVDETGRRIVLPMEVRRVVSLAPNLTETIYALGAESRLVGDTDFCDVPAAAKSKPHVGAPLSPSLEAIVGLKPDLVLATTAINRRTTVDGLERLGVPVYTTDPHSVEGLLAGIEHLAGVIGIPQPGRDLAASLRSRLDALNKALAGEPRCRALFVVWEDPLTSIGQNTFIADALKFAGVESVVDTPQDWPRVSLEAVVHMQPEVLIFARDHGDMNPDLADLRRRAG
ncbi:MAG TPA: helical backbone metal receptor, partial [Candidatus Acidoferrales bacterium]|nr:helical backbone metal receptor [Candidatus Acidoferrales bacterium]